MSNGKGQEKKKGGSPWVEDDDNDVDVDGHSLALRIIPIHLCCGLKK